ncbi:hypothetical protein TNCT_192471 [Trichonephila clavata]|uniref:Uncharacterized protein n=1 Tax=Trichonephila clavata TaxID=2740835 RepID=A0A8X6H1S7_TRICU|nr:hypothetical protein TNCT_192471 [Trichonephila clavata]
MYCNYYCEAWIAITTAKLGLQLPLQTMDCNYNCQVGIVTTTEMRSRNYSLFEKHVLQLPLRSLDCNYYGEAWIATNTTVHDACLLLPLPSKDCNHEKNEEHELLLI